MGDTVGAGSDEFKLFSQELQPVGGYGSVDPYTGVFSGITGGAVAPGVRGKLIEDQVELDDTGFNRDVAVSGLCALQAKIDRWSHFVGHPEGLAQDGIRARRDGHVPPIVGAPRGIRDKGPQACGIVIASFKTPVRIRNINRILGIVQRLQHQRGSCLIIRSLHRMALCGSLGAGGSHPAGQCQDND